MRGAAGAAPAGGIQFNTEPQSGGWLDIETTGGDGSGLGLHLQNVEAVEIDSDAGIVLHVDSGGTSLAMSAPDFSFTGSFSGTDDFAVNVGGSLSLNGGNGSIGISAGSGVFAISSGSLDVFNNSGDVQLTSNGGGDVVCDPTTGSFYVGPQTAPILLITPDGGGSWNYHIKTGKAFVADL